MAIRQHMLAAARYAPDALDDAFGPVHDYLFSQQTDDGGFRDRNGRSDLPFSAFALDALHALHVPPPVVSIARFLRRFGRGTGLELTQLAALIRLHTALPPDRQIPTLAHDLPAHLAAFRAADGSYNTAARAPQGTLYAAFWALTAAGDLNLPLSQPDRLTAAIHALALPDGGYANDPLLPLATTASTAAAVMLLHDLNAPVHPRSAAWLLDRAAPRGGFRPTAHAPIPDLPSTAAAIHALALLRADLAPIRDNTLDFLDSLWSSKGGFCGSWADTEVDVESTWYALLTLGHLTRH